MEKKKKIRLLVIGVSYSQMQLGAHGLLLAAQEKMQRKLPIIIGGNEAQSIAMVLSNMKPNRPLTHDLFQSVLTAFKITVKEVIICRFESGVFYSQLICEEKTGLVQVLDARASDAIALAIRFDCAIYTYESILDNTGITINQTEQTPSGETKNTFETPPEELKTTLRNLSLNKLHEELEQAVKAEDYEQAATIRDEIKRRKTGS